MPIACEEVDFWLYWLRYCFNNPLIYTDPSGKLIFAKLALLRGLFDAIKSGGINWHLSKESRHEAWTNADPFLKGTAPNNYAKIWCGLFVTNENKNSWGRSWELVSRFTWQIPQTAAGYLTGQFTNVFKDVYDVEYFYGATVL